MEASVRKTTLLQAVKAGVLSLVFSCIGVLLLALLAKLCNIPDTLLPTLNQILKVVSVALGTLLSVKDEKFLLKGLIGAGIFWLLSLALFAIMGGQFNLWQILLDLVIALVVAAIVCFIKSKRA